MSTASIPGKSCPRRSKTDRLEPPTARTSTSPNGGPLAHRPIKAKEPYISERRTYR
ncbi:hypothetical protein HMPREF0762_01280 [Slackia exigua ATCC 700122]|uniref:Uncharacterized protein n=1 Tax=Slackia exigua (strain ATCC 700122 / DSM 15923 / CIP 105133 / JCM 11022 / KCTC 5966 / S-7) TaxID=649764 RepID=D0WH15_SLAES|nr:hypothetical protein HMPREF0762_01280 [Slackia exigua ATCC 700122]